jgi:polyisoprenoid-binding protein YceI
MKLRLCLSLAIVPLVLFFTSKWKPDTNKAQVNFSVKGPFGTVHGKFTGLKADIKFSSDDLNSSAVSASIEAKTVSTGIGLRNRDLRKKEEWLDTDKYPLISFKSDKIEKKGSSYIATGDLTLKGKTKQTAIPFTFSGKGNNGVFKGKFVIKREDFNVGKEGGSVGNEVTIELNIPVKK